jgi:hypothetical protein
MIIKKEACMLVLVANAGNRNVIKKEAEKALKYKYITIEIQCMWNVKTNVIPEILGINGTILKSFRKYRNNVIGKQEIKELQKTVTLGTAHIPRKVLMYKYKRFVMGNNTTCTINCNPKLTAT